MCFLVTVNRVTSKSNRIKININVGYTELQFYSSP